jgi:hypothetical protein
MLASTVFFLPSSLHRPLIITTMFTKTPPLLLLQPITAAPA